MLQTAGPAALVVLQSGRPGSEVEPLPIALRHRSWPGDAVLAELVAATALGEVTGRRRLKVDLDMIGELLCDEGGGYLDLGTGTAWPLEIVELGEVDSLEPFGDPDPELWVEVPGYGSRDAYTDMADFTADLTDPRVREDLAASLKGRGAFRRFQNALNRHEVYRVHWRVFSTERRLGRARAWLAEQGYDALP